MTTFLGRIEEAKAMIERGTMHQLYWLQMTPAQRSAARDNSGLCSHLVGLEGRRVEVVDEEGDKPRRFNVGRSTGWKPCHLEVHNKRSRGGQPANAVYHSIRIIR